jgi:hypothetical protein
VKDGYNTAVGETYTPDCGPHAGHTVTVIGDDMPSERFDVVVGSFDRWVSCECGAAWSFVLYTADEAAKDHF